MKKRLCAAFPADVFRSSINKLNAKPKRNSRNRTGYDELYAGLSAKKYAWGIVFFVLFLAGVNTLTENAR